MISDLLKTRPGITLPQRVPPHTPVLSTKFSLLLESQAPSHSKRRLFVASSPKPTSLPLRQPYSIRFLCFLCQRAGTALRHHSKPQQAGLEPGSCTKRRPCQ